MKRKGLYGFILYIELMAVIILVFWNRNEKFSASASTELSIRKKYGTYIDEAAEQYHICPELIEAMIERESNGIADSVSSGGDIGLMQINPRWHHGRMDKLGVKNLTDPWSNILVAADYLAELFVRYGDLPMVLMVYNGTSDALKRWENGNYTEYAADIMERSMELEKEREKYR